MTFDLQAIIVSKKEMRRRRATLPLVEKLRILDQLRERTLAIVASRARRKSAPRSPAS